MIAPVTNEASSEAGQRRFPTCRQGDRDGSGA
jgi:hypothetical protein